MSIIEKLGAEESTSAEKNATENTATEESSAAVENGTHTHSAEEQIIKEETATEGGSTEEEEAELVTEDSTEDESAAENDNIITDEEIAEYHAADYDITDEEDITESVINETSKTDEEKDENKKTGKLFIVSTPIGNKSDYTLRAIDVLRVSDYVVCEEYKEGSRIMRELNLRKELISLNEQNEMEVYSEIIGLIEDGNRVSLVSDCGTPLFADPGNLLVDAVIEKGLPIEIVPGVTSIMTALVRANMDISKFLYAGFLDRTPETRRDEINALAKHPTTVVLLETPYRLMPVLKSFTDVMPNRRAYVGFNLTMKHESHHYGTFQELLDKFEGEKIKAEFVIVFEGNQAVGFDNVKFADKPYWRKDIKERLGDRWDDNRSEKKFEEGHSDRKFGADRDNKKTSYGGGGRDGRRKPQFGAGAGGERKSYGGGGSRDDDRRPSYGSDGGSRDDKRSSYGGGGSRDDKRSSYGGGGSRDDKRSSYGGKDDRRKPYDRDRK